MCVGNRTWIFIQNQYVLLITKWFLVSLSPAPRWYWCVLMQQPLLSVSRDTAPRLPQWSFALQAVLSRPPSLPLHLSLAPVETWVVKSFCFMSQLLFSLFSPSVPGESQEHSPDILKLLAPHPRLKEHVESMATEGTSHNLPKLSQVKLNSPSSLMILRLALLWAHEKWALPLLLWFLSEKETCSR